MTAFSRLELYEHCVQNPRALVPLLMGVHGGEPRVMREDFCGSAAVSREWLRTISRTAWGRPGKAERSRVRRAHRAGRNDGPAAIAVDLDPVPLRRARRAAPTGLHVVEGNAISTASPRGLKADVIFVGNFSIGEIHDRPTLLKYLRACHARLVTGRGGHARRGSPTSAGDVASPASGVFVCDTYGGSSAFTRGAVQRTHPLPSRRGDERIRIRYTWEQREADPLTGRVVNALHFRVEQDGEIVQEITDAFIYHWRLWSVPELRDAMSEAGFASTAVYGELPDATDSDGRCFATPISSADELNEHFIVCVAGRA